MMAFWALFKKEFRFLIGPGIAMLVLLLTGFAAAILTSYLFPDYFTDLLRNIPNKTPLVYTFFIAPIMFGGATAFLYATLLLYTVIHERGTRSEYQLFMLPTTRKMHLLAKFAAITAWLAGLYAAVIMYSIIVNIMRSVFSVYVYEAPYDINIFGMIHGMLSLLAVCALFLCAYVVARAVGRLSAVTGIIVVLVGYYGIQWLRVVVRRYIESFYQHNSDRSLFDQFLQSHSILGYDMFVYGFMMLLFLVIALMLYERTSEV